jgi:hypothetical protein
MTVPSTNVKFSDIYAEANGGYTSGLLSLVTMSFFSYFAGPNGSNSQADNNYGQGEGSGANRIYDTTAKITNIQVGDFDGITYFYDNSTFQVTLNVTNNLPLPTTPPDPPDLNDINVNITLYDSTVSYSYITGGGLATSNGGTFGPSAISQTTSPIIFRGYWEVNIQGQNPSFGGGSADLSINGNSKFTAQAVAGGPGGSTFIFSSFSTEDVASFGGFTGLYFDVTVF